MQITVTPKLQIITLWRCALICYVSILAIIFSIFSRPGSAVWWVLSGSWCAAFLLLYLFYFPMRQRSLSYFFDSDQFTHKSGVIFKVSRTVPYASIQYVRVRSSPLHKVWDLSSLTIVVPGGRVFFSGLGTEDLDRVMPLLLDGCQLTVDN